MQISFLPGAGNFQPWQTFVLSIELSALRLKNYSKTLIICAHLIFAKFAHSLKSRN